eukprot:g8278.t1
MFGLFSKRGKTAHLGDENTLYYNEELKRWVERGKEHEVVEDSIPPPPVVANTNGVTQQRPDKADPSSRYVVAGGFGRAQKDVTENDTFTPFAPAPISTPKPVEFLVPAVIASELPASPAEAAAAGNTEKYKGFRVPKFTKPELMEGTQEQYEENEVKKWKAKIDKREARKQNGGADTIHRNKRSGSGKLENDWFANTTESPDLTFGATQSFASIEQVFGATEVDPTVFLQTNVMEPVALCPVPNGQDLQSSETPVGNDELHVESSEQNGHQSWMNNGNPSSELDDQIDFDSWENPVEGEAAAAVAVEAPVPVKVSEETPYNEAEFPGGIRETDDPYDIAWLTQTGWTDHEQCKAITLWMCENYQQEWRNWHKENPVWDQFWCWYYDGGDELIHTKPAGVKTEDVTVANKLHGVEAYPPTETHPELEPPNQDTPLPDVWMETPLINEGETDVGNLSFAIFTQDGLLQFLQKLDSIFIELNSGSPVLTTFHQQVKQLVQAVESHGPMGEDHLENPSMSNATEDLKEALEKKDQEIEDLQTRLEASNADLTFQAKLNELEEFISSQEKLIESLRTNYEASEAALLETKDNLNKTVHQIKTLEGELESKENELVALRDQVKNQMENKDHSSQLSSAEGEKLKRENKVLKKKLLSLMKKSEDQVSMSNPSSPASVTSDQPFTEKPSSPVNQQSESNAQLAKQVTVLKKKVLQQKKELEEKETQIAGLTKTETANHKLHGIVEKTKMELEEKETLVEQLRASLWDKENEILKLMKDLDDKTNELESLQQKMESESVHVPTNIDLKDRKLSRLEDDLLQKQQDIKILEAQVQGISQKDSLISKLTSLVGDNDFHINQLRVSLEEHRKKESELMESISAKDIDLENLVRSVMISQKQIYQLKDYCSQLGGNPNQLLINMQSVGN